MVNNFRSVAPVRTCKKTFVRYKSYKPYISKDFNNRCGYTDCSDSWFGGPNSFHIDHFKPFSKNPALKTDYSNLVYCCSYINILKSNDEGDYIDPCNIDFNEHFERDADGVIFPKDGSTAAKYMHTKLKLSLRRYSIVWKLDKLQIQLNKLKEEFYKPENSDMVSALREIHSKLAEEFTEYIEYLKKEL